MSSPPHRTCTLCGEEYDPHAAEGGDCPHCRHEPSHLTFDAEAPPPWVGREEEREQIGPYRLLEKLGEGGMGVVYLAQQETPIRRRVAVKLIKPGMDSDRVVARFESERQALALMNHPNIASVFDGGLTDDGRPYFAMELVQGTPITSYCDRHRLTTRERLELLAEVCDGVQHAHQKGVIHRDLKPANILVGEVDGRACPKIIDFGVAKAISQPLTERTLFTQLGQWIGTPEYMSPEQADLTAEDIDTRTDVYSLGVLLYELLTGGLPFDPAELRAAGFEEMRRKIRETDPPRPSTRVSSLLDTSADIAKDRRLAPASLVQHLRGDLDWISMKAIEKERSRRYASSGELASDIRRHLGHLPVLAGPPSATYRLRKFVRRHRAGSFAAVVVFAALLFTGLALTIQAGRIVRERDRANLAADRAATAADRAATAAETSRQVSDFLQSLFRVSDPSEARGNAVTAREILDQGAERIEGELEEQPAVRAQLMETIGIVYHGLGLVEPATDLLTKALALRRTLSEAPSPELARSMAFLATVHRAAGRLEESEGLVEGTLAMRRQLHGEVHKSVAGALNDLGLVRADRGNLAGSEEAFREAISQRRELFGTESGEVAASLTNLAQTLKGLGNYDEAAELSLEALEIGRRVQGDDHPDFAAMVNNHSNLLRLLEDLDGAEKYRRESTEVAKKIWGEKHPNVAGNLNNLGTLLRVKGELEESEVAYRASLELFRELLPAGHPALGTVTSNLAQTLQQQGRLADAEILLDQALEIYRARLPADHPDIAEVVLVLAGLVRERGDEARAEALFEEALTKIRSAQGVRHINAATALTGLASIHLSQKRPERGVPLLEEALSIVVEALPAGHSRIPAAEKALGAQLIAAGDFERAEDLLLQALERQVGSEDTADRHAAETRRRLEELYREWGKPEQAAEYSDGD